MEWWNNGILGIKSGLGLILLSESCHSDKNKFHSAKPNIPSFQCSIIPRHMNTAQSIFSDLAQKTEVSVLE